jgi:hypothetical protein
MDDDRGRQQRRKNAGCTAEVPFWNGKITEIGGRDVRIQAALQ